MSTHENTAVARPQVCTTTVADSGAVESGGDYWSRLPIAPDIGFIPRSGPTLTANDKVAA